MTPRHCLPRDLSTKARIKVATGGPRQRLRGNHREWYPTLLSLISHAIPPPPASPLSSALPLRTRYSHHKHAAYLAHFHSRRVTLTSALPDAYRPSPNPLLLAPPSNNPLLAPNPLTPSSHAHYPNPTAAKISPLAINCHRAVPYVPLSSPPPLPFVPPLRVCSFDALGPDE